MTCEPEMDLGDGVSGPKWMDLRDGVSGPK